MYYSVTLHLKSGLEIEYIERVKGGGIKEARTHVESKLSIKETWMVLDDDVMVKRSQVDYFKLKLIEE